MARTAGTEHRSAGRHRRTAYARDVGPNWYAAIMGLAAVPGGGIALFPGIGIVWQVAWALTAAAFVALLATRLIHHVAHADVARAHLHDPAMAPFYACAAIAFLAVGLTTETVGSPLLGAETAFAIYVALFVLGTALGLVVVVAVILLMIVRHDLRPETISPVWLLPAMGPMVSAAFASPLLTHLPAGDLRQTLTLCLYAMFGLDLVATLIVLPLVLHRLLVHGPLDLPLTPAVIIGVAPFGQAVNAVCNLADTMPGSGFDEATRRAIGALPLIFGVPTMGFALLWLAIGLGLVVRSWRKGAAFSMAWWSFGFPIGTVVAGLLGIERHSHLAAFGFLAAGIYLLMVALVAVTAYRTIVVQIAELLRHAAASRPGRDPA